MARLKDGALGGFSGKVGSVIGYSYRNKDYIRSIPVPSKKPPTLKQLASRARFKFFNEWRNPLSGFFNVTFKNQTNTHSAQNAAHQLNKDIITGEYPDFIIDYTKVIISKGSLPPVLDLQMQHENDMLYFTWQPNLINTAMGTDLLAILVCYTNNINHFQASLNAAERGSGNCAFKLDYTAPGEKIEIYATFLSNNRERASDSHYMGSIEF
ncbi:MULTISPECIES: DUF6266 family protein [unclassified Pedobacter]|uniref:DUF6266 family protein n=1 Tax=unclassified Pedobacter TaxID=2628915 RepID=UPI00141D94FF|nr:MULTISPECIES: DUF6266 family protein [unclassified Pedobacter]NII85519.1 hypothetical protein [Pedobacter sp. SG908]NMN39564.1 hypothetical protein [Pedobacter sp. SG918]